MNNTSVSSTR